MLSIISFVGFSTSGKTSLLEKVVPCLKARGYRVGVVKHATHQVEFDHPGKDSWRLARAGADMLALVSANQTMLLEHGEREAPPEEVIALFEGKVDLVLTEGYKYGPFPKVLLCGTSQPCLPLQWWQDELLAIVTPRPLPSSVPQFHPEDVASLVELLADAYPHFPGIVSPQCAPLTRRLKTSGVILTQEI